MGMMDDFDNDFDFEEMGPEEGLSGEESGNKTFLIVAGVMGAILLLSLIGIAVYAMTAYPKQQAASETRAAEIIAQNNQIALSAQLTEEAKAWTATPTDTSTPTPTDIPLPTSTSTSEVVPPTVAAPTNTPVVAAPLADTPDPHTATVAALLTQQAAGALTPTVTALPEGGFADSVGIPGMVAIAGVLLVIIILSRRLRKSAI